MAPHYILLPTEAKEGATNTEQLHTEAPNHHTARHITFKRAALCALAVLAVMYALMFGIKQAPSACRMWRSKSTSMMHQTTYGANRTMSTGLPNSYTLPSGDKIPSVALGVWRADRDRVGAAVKTALETGYRHIDGAWVYGNEAEVGKAIRDSGVPREDIWITSKLWNNFHAPEDVEPVLEESLSRLGIDYLDLYLIHWPVAFRKGAWEIDFDLTENPYPTWQKLEEMVAKGKVRNIGVSNFSIRRLQNLTANPLKIKPAINQVEINYWFPQTELLQWSKENGILLEAYSPLGSQERVKKSLEVPEVKSIAKQLDITPAQVLISWHVQRGTVVLPKSVTASRVKENLHVMRLPQDAFDMLEKAATSHKPERGSNPDWGVDIWN